MAVIPSDVSIHTSKAIIVLGFEIDWLTGDVPSEPWQKVYCFILLHCALSRLCSDCHAHTASRERERDRDAQHLLEQFARIVKGTVDMLHMIWYVLCTYVTGESICPSGWFARSPFGACTTRCNTVSSQAVIFICWESVLDSWSRFILTEDKSSRTCSPNILEHYPQRPNVSDSQSVDKVADSQRRRRAERSLCWSELGGRYSDKMWQDQAMSGNVVWCFLSQ